MAETSVHIDPPASDLKPEPETDLDRFAAFCRFYAEIHALDGAYAEGMAAHRAAADRLFEQSLGFLDRLPWSRIATALDVGMGYGRHCAAFAKRGLKTTGLTVHLPPELRAHAREHAYEVVEGDMHEVPADDGAYDLVWSSHSLEHSFSPLLALREWLRVCKPGGWLAVTVPPHKSQVVSGHFTTGWSVGQLAYMLAVAGCDCREWLFVREGYNVRALVRRPATDARSEGASWMFNAIERLPSVIRASAVVLPNSLGKLAFEGEIDRIEPEEGPLVSTRHRPARDA